MPTEEKEKGKYVGLTFDHGLTVSNLVLVKPEADPAAPHKIPKPILCFRAFMDEYDSPNQTYPTHSNPGEEVFVPIKLVDQGDTQIIENFDGKNPQKIHEFRSGYQWLSHACATGS